MTTDTFENELRALLHDTADAHGLDDLGTGTDTVMLRGRRAVRRRRAIAGAGIAAAMLVVGIAGWSAASSGVDRASVPAGTTSTRPEGPSTAVLEQFSDLSDKDGKPLPIPGPTRVAVTIDPTHTPDLIYSQVDPDGTLTMMGGSSLDGVAALTSTWGTAGEGSHVVVGVLPGQARAFQLVTPITDEGGHPSTSVTKRIPGTDRQAFAVRFADAGDAGAVRHLLWWAPDGTVHDENGAVIASVALADEEDTTFFFAENLDRMGTFSANGGASMMTLDASRNSSGRPVLSTGTGRSGEMRGLFVAVVPRGTKAGDIAADPRTRVTHEPATIELPGTDSSVLWAAFTTQPPTTGSAWPSVSWTEPGGHHVTQKP